MTDDRERFNKVLAIAISPGAYEAEAIAALRKARELVGNNPTLAHPPPPPELAPKPITHDEYYYENKVTNIAQFWLPILITNLSEEAYKLRLISKITCDFTQNPTAVNVRCDGPKKACFEFHWYLTWLVNHINSRPRHGVG
jgi:hypothetical protein